MADDDVFKTVDMYFRGLWDKPKVLEELRYYKRNEDEFYKQNLENDIILYLAEKKNMAVRKAFDIYYSSRLANQIANGDFGIENMDAKYLAEDLMENESGLFE